MQTSRDAAGNKHGVLLGAEKAAKSIVIGSHLDTVPSGGLFDGTYGVAGGLEVIRCLKEEGRTIRWRYTASMRKNLTPSAGPLEAVQLRLGRPEATRLGGGAEAIWSYRTGDHGLSAGFFRCEVLS